MVEQYEIYQHASDNNYSLLKIGKNPILKESCTEPGLTCNYDEDSFIEAVVDKARSLEEASTPYVILNKNKLSSPADLEAKLSRI